MDELETILDAAICEHLNAPAPKVDQEQKNPNVIHVNNCPVPNTDN